MSWKRVCSTSDVPSNGMKQFTAEGGDAILVLNSGGALLRVPGGVSAHGHAARGRYVRRLDAYVPPYLWQWDIESGDPKSLAEQSCFHVVVTGDASASTSSAGTEERLPQQSSPSTRPARGGGRLFDPAQGRIQAVS